MTQQQAEEHTHRRTVVTDKTTGDVTETATDALSSVEIGETAKGFVKIESVKVYDADPKKAADRAWRSTWA